MASSSKIAQMVDLEAFVNSSPNGMSAACCRTYSASVSMDHNACVGPSGNSLGGVHASSFTQVRASAPMTIGLPLRFRSSSAIMGPICKALRIILATALRDKPTESAISL